MPTLGLRSGKTIKITQQEYDELFLKVSQRSATINKLKSCGVALAPDVAEYVAPWEPDQKKPKRKPAKKVASEEKCDVCGKAYKNLAAHKRMAHGKPTAEPEPQEPQEIKINPFVKE